eukprot:gene24449-31839_t
MQPNAAARQPRCDAAERQRVGPDRVRRRFALRRARTGDDGEPGVVAGDDQAGIAKPGDNVRIDIGSAGNQDRPPRRQSDLAQRRRRRQLCHLFCRQPPERYADAEKCLRRPSCQSRRIVRFASGRDGHGGKPPRPPGAGRQWPDRLRPDAGHRRAACADRDVVGGEAGRQGEGFDPDLGEDALEATRRGRVVAAQIEKRGGQPRGHIADVGR